MTNEQTGIHSTGLAFNQPQKIDTPAESAFRLANRQAIALSKSSLVPKEYQGENGVANCLVALNMAMRMGTDPMLVMQNLHVIQGRPSFGASFLIASVNGCGKFSPMRYEFAGDAGSDSYACRAYAIEHSTGDRLDGSWITMAMAKAEGWTTKAGSKWKTMPEQMLRYRAGSFWQRVYAPEISMGMLSSEELQDITPQRGVVSEDIRALEREILGEQAPLDADTIIDGDVQDDDLP